MANVPTTSWSESSPAGTDAISAGDDRIREMKTQIREVIGVDHDFPSSGQAADNGQHLRSTYQEQADLGTGATGVPILGAQTVNGKAELMFTDEDDNDIQLSDAGSMGSTTTALKVYTVTQTSRLVNDTCGYVPIGAVVAWMKSLTGTPDLPGNFVECNGQTLSDAESALNGQVIPNLNGLNRFLRGNSTSGTTGGSATHTLTLAELPSGVTQRIDLLGAAGGSDRTAFNQTPNLGSGNAHNNEPQYTDVVWIMRIK